MGTDEYAAEHLKFLLKNNVKISLVISQPDRPKGRGKKLLPTSTKLVAQEFGVEIIQPQKLTIKISERLREFDLGIVVSYGKIIPQHVLDAPRLGLYNVHPSLLPRWRGAAPIQRALEAGDQKTGVTIFKVIKELDAGPIALQRQINIGYYETYGELSERLIELGNRMLLEFLKLAENGNIKLKPQPNEGAIYAKKIEKDELKVDFFEPAEKVKDKIRAFDPKPGVYAFLEDKRVKLFGVVNILKISSIPGSILKIDKDGAIISCGEGAVKVAFVQFPGKKPIRFIEAVNGRLIKEGNKFK